MSLSVRDSWKVYAVWPNDYEVAPDDVKIFQSHKEALDWIVVNTELYTYREYNGRLWTVYGCDYLVVEYDTSNQSSQILNRYNRVEFEGEYG